MPFNEVDRTVVAVLGEEGFVFGYDVPAVGSLTFGV